MMPFLVTDKDRKRVEGDLDKTKILQAASDGNTKDLEMHLGPVRRLTRAIKAHAVVDAVKDEFD